LAGGLVAAGLLAPGRARQRLGASGAVALAAAVGFVDDHRGDASSKGLRGHLGALRQGRVTTGLIKIVGLGTAAALAAACEPGSSLASAAPRRPGLRAGAAWAIDTTVIAGLANVVNLLDLRPGRALKAAALPLAASLAGRRGGRWLGGLSLAMSAAALPGDLGEKTMLGDCGAGALGTAAGLAVVRSAPLPVRTAVAGLVAGLTLASERASFSAVIAKSPWLDRLDQLGTTRKPGSELVEQAYQGRVPEATQPDSLGAGPGSMSLDPSPGQPE